MVVKHIFEDDVEGIVGVDLHLHWAQTKPSRSVMNIAALELGQLCCRLEV